MKKSHLLKHIWSNFCTGDICLLFSGVCYSLNACCWTFNVLTKLCFHLLMCDGSLDVIFNISALAKKLKMCLSWILKCWLFWKSYLFQFIHITLYIQMGDKWKERCWSTTCRQNSLNSSALMLNIILTKVIHLVFEWCSSADVQWMEALTWTLEETIGTKLITQNNCWSAVTQQSLINN